jgi:hypothetical protein
MAIKFAAKDPAKGEPAKSVKDVAAAKVPVEKTGDDAVDLFESDSKPTGRKPKSK